jgi:hypothetical protein
MKILRLLPLLLAAAASTTFAGEHVYAPYTELYVRECASCHLAYPPELMTAPGWKRVMSQLDRHFGSDASLDTPTRDGVAAFLAQRASSREKHARISKTVWFVREHGTAPPPKISFANCSACHTRAEQADFNERSLRLPAGFRPSERD